VPFLPIVEDKLMKNAIWVLIPLLSGIGSGGLAEPIVAANPTPTVKAVTQPNVVQCPPTVEHTAVKLPSGWTAGTFPTALSHGYTSEAHPGVLYCYYKEGVLLTKQVAPNSCRLAADKKSFVCRR
jgi:hypothetical protein